MITKYRNKGLVKLGAGISLILLGVFVGIASAHSEYRQLGGFVGVVSGIFGLLLYIFGCTDLLKAKGYDSSMALAFIIPALCCTGAYIFFAPPIILFVMKDKTRSRK
jgi:hypothetical protein